MFVAIAALVGPLSAAQAANTGPTVTPSSPLIYATGQTATAIDPGVAVVDIENVNISSATVAITSGFAGLEDELGYTGSNGITGTYDASNGELALTGTANVGRYEAALRSVTYRNSSQTPAVASRTVTFTVDDGTTTGSATQTIVLIQPRVAPILTTRSSAGDYTENAPATAVDPGLTVTDADSPLAASARVSISENFATSQDVLSFQNRSDISGSYHSETGVLTLSGTATVAAYQAALRSVTYTNTSDDPSALMRTFSFTVTDQGGYRALTTTIGGGGGSPTASWCPAGTVLTGVTTFTVSYLRNLRAECETLVTTASVVSASGAAAQGPFMRSSLAGFEEQIACAGDEVATGFGGRSGTLVDGFRLLCRGLSAAGAAMGNESQTAAVGGGGGNAQAPVRCPLDAVATGIDGRAGDGIDSIRFVCDDLGVASATAMTSVVRTRQITVTAVNDVPTASPDRLDVSEASPVTRAAPGVLANDSDPEDPGLSVAEVAGAAGNVGVQRTTAAGAKVTIDAYGSLSYDPNGQFAALDAGQTAVDSITYRASDGSAASTITSVTFTINGVSNTPAGSRVIRGSAGNDTINGTPANDVIICGAGDDIVNAGAGDDWIDCGDGNDRVGGGAGNDSLIGGAGDDHLSGGTGKDTLRGKGGRDVLDGNAGNDRLDGGVRDDRVHGNAGNDRLYGDAGDDILVGGAGDDRLHAGAGADRAGGGTGRDLLLGGTSNDRLGGGAGADRVDGGAGDDRLSGGPGVDRIYGHDGSDRLRGGAGADLLWGGDGNDRLYGHDGNDRLNGGPGDDRLSGGADDDRLSGAAGTDRLFGGSGIDVLLDGPGVDVGDASGRSEPTGRSRGTRAQRR